MDLRLQTNAVLQIVGPSGSGKTHFVCRLLARQDMFREKIGTIYWLQGTVEGEEGDTEKCMEKLGKRLKIIRNGFIDGWENLAHRGDALIIDDLFHESTKEKNFVSLFTKIARHRHVLVVFITQNLFHKSSNSRTQNLNVHYLAMFRNPRDKTAIDHLARQMYPNNRKFLIDSFDDATSNRPHSYLFFDFTQECNDDIRVRTNILFEDGQRGIIVYKQITDGE